MEPDVRDSIVDFVAHWNERSECTIKHLLRLIGLSKVKYHRWRERFGKLNEHNAQIPRDFWLEGWEKQKIIEYFSENELEGYRRLCYMMMDADIIAVSPSTVYRVLKSEGLLRRWNGKESKKGTGFTQPLKPHEHWHIDISYLNICGTFYYMTSILDGCSRSVLHWDIREQMTERDVEIVIERCREKFPGVSPRIISDNGPQFVAKDFKEYIRIAGMTHVRTSPYYPQSNGKLERYHRTIKTDCIRPKTPLSLDDAKRLVADFVEYYNTRRLHSALSYITPQDMLEGRQEEILCRRERKLEAARALRKERRQTLRMAA